MHPSSNNPTGIRSVQRGFQWISQFQLSWNYSSASLASFSCSSSEWDTVIEDGLNSIWSFQNKTLLNVQQQGQMFPLLNLLWSKTGNGKWPSAFAPTFHWILGEAIQMLRLVWNKIPVNLLGRTIERGNEKWPFTSEAIISLHITIISWQRFSLWENRNSIFLNKLSFESNLEVFILQ